MSNDMFGTIAKAYMIADMMTPPKQAQVIYSGWDDADVSQAVNSAVDARTREANRQIHKANAAIRSLQKENENLRSSMMIARERVLEVAREQDYEARERAEYTAELEVQNRLLREELASVENQNEILNRQVRAIENRSEQKIEFGAVADRETVDNSHTMTF